GLDIDGGRKTLRRCPLLIPTHVEPTLGLVLEFTQGGGLDRVDRNALTRRQDADDAVAWHGTSIRRKSDGQITIDPADGNRGSDSTVRHLELDRGDLSY